MALFGIVSVAVYKFFSKKDETPKKQETTTVDARTDELVNFIAWKTDSCSLTKGQKQQERKKEKLPF